MGELTDVVVRCACGVTYGMKAWDALDFVGIQDDGIDTLIEMRNCVCGSTRARRCDAARTIVLLNQTAKRLRQALGRMRDIDRACTGMADEIDSLDRGVVRPASIGDVGERGRCIRIVRETLGSIQPHESIGKPGWLATLSEVLEARLKVD